MHRMNIPFKWLSFTCILIMAAMLFGCTSSENFSDRTGIKFTEGRMFHIQQVLEYYDAAGNAVPRYLEFWLTKDKGRCLELDPDGNELMVSIDTGKKHLFYDSENLSAQQFDKSQLFLVNFSAMKKVYPNKLYSKTGQYANRDCIFHLMDNGNEEEWIKLYLDKESGYVLLADSETFRLRTALFEEVPIDDAFFTEPEGLMFKGGNDN